MTATLVEYSLSYFKLIEKLPKFIFVPYSKLKPTRIEAFLTAYEEDKREKPIIRNKFVDEAADDRDAYLLTNFAPPSSL